MGYIKPKFTPLEAAATLEMLTAKSSEYPPTKRAIEKLQKAIKEYRNGR